MKKRIELIVYILNNWGRYPTSRCVQCDISAIWRCLEGTTKSGSRHHIGKERYGADNHDGGDCAKCDEKEQEPCTPQLPGCQCHDSWCQKTIPARLSRLRCSRHTMLFLKRNMIPSNIERGEYSSRGDASVPTRFEAHCSSSRGDASFPTAPQHRSRPYAGGRRFVLLGCEVARAGATQASPPHVRTAPAPTREASPLTLKIHSGL